MSRAHLRNKYGAGRQAGRRHCVSPLPIMGKKSAKKKLLLSDKVGQKKSSRSIANLAINSKGKIDSSTNRSNISSTKKRDNPFELKFNKQKHSLLGRNTNGASASVRVGKPGFSKRKAFDRRKETLLGEFHKLNKSNRLVDGRIDEKNPNLSQDQKAARRLTLERQKLFKKRGVYQLNEEEEDSIHLLTHGGQNLADELHDQPTYDRGEDLEAMDAEFVARAHFGGGEEDEEVPISRSDLISDLISESKKLRHEKQVQRSQQEDLTESLDSKWKEVIQENLLGQLVSSGKKHGGEHVVKDVDKDPHQDYDQIFNSLKFERHTVKATDRLETPEEIAKNEKVKLENLEKQRLQRMKLVQPDGTSHEHVSADDDISGKVRLERSKATGGKIVIKYDKDGRLIEDEPNDDDEELSELSAPSDLELSDKAEDDEYFGCGHSVPTSDSKSTEPVTSTKTEIPFVFDMPKTYEYLARLLRGHTKENQGLVLERLIKCHHPSLREGNKQKLKKLFVFLLRYLDSEYVAVSNLDFVDPATRALYSLTQLFPGYAGDCVKKVLKRHRETQRIKGQKRKFPPMSSFLLLRLIPTLFSVSDFQHPVGVPALIFGMEILKRVQIRGMVDAAKGLLLCGILSEYVVQSKRYLPEVVGFLHGILHVAVDHEEWERAPTKSFPLCSPEDKILVVSSSGNEKIGKIDLNQLFLGATVDRLPQGFRENCIATCVKLISTYAEIYESLPSYAEIFNPLVRSLRRLPSEFYPEDLSALVTQTVDSLCKRISSTVKVGVKAQEVKTREFKFLEPRIELGYNPERNKKVVGPKKGPKAERKKLIHQLKKETRGAMRELRKDSQFLAREKLKKTMERDSERKEKTKNIMKSLRGQQNEEARETKIKKKKKH